MTRALKVMLVAVEASADGLGAGLARALRQRLDGDVEIVGVGGPAMAAAGVTSPVDIARLSLVGLFEMAGSISRAFAMIEETVRLAETVRPDVVVLIDSWEFTWRVARRLRMRTPEAKLAKYVAPQVWATRPGRARAAARLFDVMMTLFPFETRYFEDEGLSSVCVGAPALRRDFSGVDGRRFRQSIGAGHDDEILLLLPGSRPAEIDRLLPHFEAAAMQLISSRPDLRLVLPAAATVARVVRDRASRWRTPPLVIEDEASKFAAMRAATLALACSGTVTTELAAAGCPMIVAYRGHPATALIARMILRTRSLCLVNIAAGTQVAPELLQGRCTSQELVAAAASLLDDPVARARQSAAQAQALHGLGLEGPDPFDAAADAVLRLADARAATRITSADGEWGRSRESTPASRPARSPG